MSSSFKMDKDFIKNKEKNMFKNKTPNNFSLPKNSGLIYKKNILSSIKDIPINTNNFNVSYSFLKNFKLPNFGNNKSNPSSTSLSTNSTPLKIPLKENNDSNKENSNNKNKLNEYQFHQLLTNINETFLKIQKLYLQNIPCYNECILWIEQFRNIYENCIEIYKNNEFFDSIKYTLLIMFFSIIIIYDIVNQNKQKFFFDNIKNILNIHLLMSESIYNNSFNNPHINHKDEEQVLMISYKDISNRIFKIITQYQRMNLKNFQILFIIFRKLRNENYDSLYEFFIKRIKNLKHQENIIQNSLNDNTNNSVNNNRILYDQNMNKQYNYPENNKNEHLNPFSENEKPINKTQINNNNLINKSIKQDIINVNNSVNMDTININHSINNNTNNITHSINYIKDNSINNNIMNDSINNTINNSINNNIMNDSINNNLINNSINNNIMNNSINNNIMNMNNTINTNTINTNINNISINTNTISTENNLNLTFQPQIKETNNLTTIGGMGTFINNANNYFYFRKPISMQKTINSQIKGYQLNHHFNYSKFTNLKQNSNQNVNLNMNTNTYSNTNRNTNINTNTINPYNNYTHTQQPFNYPTSTPLRLMPKPSQPIYKNDYYIQNDPRLIIQETIKKPEEENESIFARFNRIKNNSRHKYNSVQKDNTIIKKNLENTDNKSNNNTKENNDNNNDNNNNNYNNIITVTIDNKTTNKQNESSNIGKIDITNLKINNSKKEEINYKTIPLIPFQPNKPYSLVLDLDETLIHVPKGKNEFILRPGLREFLHSLIPYYELIVFTIGIKEYADQIINFIEKDEKYFSYRLYRESATFLNEQYYKDLNKLGRDLKKIIIVDDKQINIKLQEENGIIIKPFITEDEGGKNDFILYDLINILTKIAKEKPNDIRESLKKYKKEIQNKISNN